MLSARLTAGGDAVKPEAKGDNSQPPAHEITVSKIRVPKISAPKITAPLG